MKAVEAPGAVTIDDEFAKTLGLESLAKLRDAVKERIAREHTLARRARSSSARCSTSSTSVTNSSRRRAWSSRNSTTSGRRSRTTSSSRTAPSPTKARPRKRRGRNTAASPSAGCGLACDRGDRREEQYHGHRRAVAGGGDGAGRASFPGRSGRSGSITRRIPNALAALRAPLFEDKVVDFLLELAEVTDKQVSRDELFKEDEE